MCRSLVTPCLSLLFKQEEWLCFISLSFSLSLVLWSPMYVQEKHSPGFDLVPSLCLSVCVSQPLQSLLDSMVPSMCLSYISGCCTAVWCRAARAREAPSSVVLCCLLSLHLLLSRIDPLPFQYNNISLHGYRRRSFLLLLKTWRRL